MPAPDRHPDQPGARHPSALRRPLLGLTTSFIAGLLLSPLWPGSPVWLLLGLVLLLAVTLLRRQGAGCALLLHLAVLLTGMACRQLEERPLSARAISHHVLRDRESLALVGVIADDPVEGGLVEGGVLWRFPVRLEAVNRTGSWHRVNGRAEVRWRAGLSDPPPRYGDRCRLEGPALLQEARPGRLPAITMGVQGPGYVRLGTATGFDLRDLCLRARRASAERLGFGIGFDPDAVGVMQAFMLGYRETLPERAHRAFSRTGTLHIAAISGAHVVILAGLLLIPLKALGLSQTRWIYVMGPLLLLYALATGLAASAVRACIMASVFWSAFAFRRRPDGPSSLALSALLILLVDPGQLWEPGFLLSFGVVAGLMLLVHPIEDPWLARWAVDDPDRKAAAGRWRRAILRPAISLVAVTLAAWLASLPMTAQFFNLFSPIGLLANLLVVPLASVILLNGCLSLTLGWMSPFLAELFNHGSRALVHLLLMLVEFFHRWPGGHCFVVAPAWGWGVAWYAWLVVMARGRRPARVAGLVALVLVGLTVWMYQRTYARPVVSVYHNGRGLSVLLEQPGRDPVLVDPGPAHAGRGLIRWLRTRGVDRLQEVILSRASADCSGALPGLLEQIPVHALRQPSGPVRSKPFQQQVEQGRAAGIPVTAYARGEEGQEGSWHWMVLHPDPAGSYARAVDGALLQRWSCGPYSMLVMGSASPVLQREVLSQPVELAARGLISLAETTGEAWVPGWREAVRPAFVVSPAPASGQAPDGSSMVEEGRSLTWPISRNPVSGN